MHMITEDEPSYHLSALYRRLSARPCRVLYVGLDGKLLQYLEESLDDCWIVRAPAGCVARCFIEHLEYALLLFDEALMDMSAQELATFARGLARRQSVPIVIVQPEEDFEWLASEIDYLLAESREEARRMAALRRELWGWPSRLTSLACCGW
jgi:hypothetical protein